MFSLWNMLSHPHSLTMHKAEASWRDCLLYLDYNWELGKYILGCPCVHHRWTVMYLITWSKDKPGTRKQMRALRVQGSRGHDYEAGTARTGDQRPWGRHCAHRKEKGVAVVQRYRGAMEGPQCCCPVIIVPYCALLCLTLRAVEGHLCWAVPWE